MGKFKRWTLALIMVAILCVLVPAVASAATLASGDCGANVKWSLSDAGVLTISGKGKMYEATYYDEDHFSYKEWTWNDYRAKIRKVQIQNGVTSIGIMAFSGCNNLTSVSIPSSVNSIDAHAFADCTGLINVTIPLGVTSIGRAAFSGCKSLTSVSIPSSVNSIGTGAFLDCTSLTNVAIPMGITHISDHMFDGCTNLVKVDIPSSVTSIGGYAFEFCKSLSDVTIPSGVTSIGEWAFKRCESLSNVTIPTGVTSIGEAVFCGCYGLTSITIPSNVTSIGDMAFLGCKSLTSVSIPSSVTRIQEKVFADCPSLKNLTIPASVKTIGAHAFGYKQEYDNGWQCILCDDVVIFGKSGSAAETYAKNNKITFIDQNNLAAPKISGVNGDAGSVTIKWGKVTGAEKYRVFYKTGNNGWKKITDTASTSYTWTGAKNGVTYTFTVRCVNSAGTAFTSDYDAAGKSITLGQLATPQITSVKANGTAVTVTWGKVSGAAQYRLFYKKNGSWTKLKDTTATSVTLNGTAGKTYTYTVRCLSADGKTYTSAYDKNGKSITLPLATPKITSVKADGTKVTVTWGKVSGAEKYRVFYKKDGKWTKLKDTTATSVTLNGTTGKTYTYTVRCVNGAGTAYTSAYDKTGKSITLGQLATPKITSATSGANGITITWSKVTGAAQYRVFYMKDGKWTKLKDTTGTSVTITGGAKGKTYTYTVRCLSADGKTYTSGYDKNGKSVTK